jgi:hypothetical protein
MITQSEHAKMHKWLKDEYGKAKRCESEKCLTNHESGSIHWCLKAGKEYEFKRANFIQLCTKCHYHYDRKHGLLGKYMKPLKLVILFTGKQRAIIRKMSKKFKISEAEYVRKCVEFPVITNSD